MGYLICKKNYPQNRRPACSADLDRAALEVSTAGRRQMSCIRRAEPLRLRRSKQSRGREGLRQETASATSAAVGRALVNRGPVRGRRRRAAARERRGSLRGWGRSPRESEGRGTAFLCSVGGWRSLLRISRGVHEGISREDVNQEAFRLGGNSLGLLTV